MKLAVTSLQMQAANNKYKEMYSSRRLNSENVKHVSMRWCKQTGSAAAENSYVTNIPVLQPSPPDSLITAWLA